MSKFCAPYLPNDLLADHNSCFLLAHKPNSQILVELKNFEDATVKNLPFRSRLRLDLHPNNGEVMISKAWPEAEVKKAFDTKKFEIISLNNEELHSIQCNKDLVRHQLKSKVKSFQLKKSVMIQWVYELSFGFAILGIWQSMHSLYLFDLEGNLLDSHEGIGEVFAGSVFKKSLLLLFSSPTLPMAILRLDSYRHLSVCEFNPHIHSINFNLEWKSYRLASKEIRRFSLLKGNKKCFFKHIKSNDSNSSKALVFVHGGPGAREGLKYRDLFSLANRLGIDIFVAHLPGSGGFGKKHYELLHRRQGELDSRSLIECLEELRNRFSLHQISLCGESYGGYVILRAQNLATLDIVKNLINFYGVVQWEDLLQDLLKFDENHPYFQMIAHPIEEELKVKKMSIFPLSFDLKSKPILSLHGSLDRNVPLNHSQKLHNEIRGTGGNPLSKLVILEGEGHEILAWENRKLCLQAIHEFWIQSGFLD